ncbi:hypothetical protein [Chromobacterium sp. ATCC 53434]|uniref:hypothetical protein n=1 Tax=Chromobacterium sp. (strain ATCC 53434 / SC 14030) TaxID=2059672 RepID=UPI0013050ED6|nr:hypothetical protein [Chromobacterium sp. ATCC 53434]
MNAIAKIISLIMVSLLAGCAMTPLVPQNPEALKFTHGFVFSPKVQSSLSDVSEVQLRSQEDGSLYTLQQSDQLCGGFGLWLPAGNYELVEMFGDSLRKHSYPPIKVRAGSFTDIGGLIWVGVGQDKRVLLSIHHPELDLQVKAVEEKQALYLLDHRVEVWKPSSVASPVLIPHEISNQGVVIDLMLEHGRKIGMSGFNKQLIDMGDSEEFLAAAKRTFPPITHSGVNGLHGEQYFGAELGQIRVRDMNGSWSSLDTGTLDSITAIAIENQTVVAATNQGKIFKKNNKQWKNVAVLPEKIQILGLTHTSEGWLILAGKVISSSYSEFSALKDMSIYQADEGFSGLIQIKKIPIDSELAIFRPAVKYVNGKYFVNGLNDLHVFDVRQGSWSLAGPGHEITSLNYDKGSNVFTAYKMQGIFSKLSISTDNGKSWVPTQSPGVTVQDIIFTSPSHAITVGIDMGLLSTSYELSQYESSDKKSTLISKSSPGVCKKIVSDEDMHLFFCISDNGSILRFDEQKMVPEFTLN